MATVRFSLTDVETRATTGGQLPAAMTLPHIHTLTQTNTPTNKHTHQPTHATPATLVYSSPGQHRNDALWLHLLHWSAIQGEGGRAGVDLVEAPTR